MSKVAGLQKELTHTINLHPSFFGPSTSNYLYTKVHADVEGTCTGKHGYIISVLSISNVGSGSIMPGSGVRPHHLCKPTVLNQG